MDNGYCPKCLKHPRLDWDAIDAQPYCLNCGYRPAAPLQAVDKRLWGGKCTICQSLCPPASKRTPESDPWQKTCSPEHQKQATSIRMQGNIIHRQMKKRVPIHLKGTPYGIQDKLFREGKLTVASGIVPILVEKEKELIIPHRLYETLKQSSSISDSHISISQSTENGLPKKTCANPKKNSIPTEQLELAI